MKSYKNNLLKIEIEREREREREREGEVDLKPMIIPHQQFDAKVIENHNDLSPKTPDIQISCPSIVRMALHFINCLYRLVKVPNTKQSSDLIFF